MQVSSYWGEGEVLKSGNKLMLPSSPIPSVVHSPVLVAFKCICFYSMVTPPRVTSFLLRNLGPREWSTWPKATRLLNSEARLN